MEVFNKLKKSEVTEEAIVDTWLRKYFNTDLATVSVNYEKEEDGTFSNEQTRKFYEDHAVTQEQHDEWLEEIKPAVRKKLNIGVKMFDRSWAFTYLNVAPQIKREKENDKSRNTG